MSVLADVFAAVRLQLDGTGFEAQATALADRQGKNVGDRMSQQLNSKLKSALSGAVGAGAGLAFASAISGATQLNELAGEYQVQTGASAQEAKAFSGVLNDLFKNAHQGYDEISATLIGLKTHFDMDGAAAKALAATVLDFAEIAGGTGADAVERLNSLVKTGVIAQADMSATLDKVTIAHQKWGININETLDSLTKFAPAMNALGMSTDEAIGWMSMFNKAGVDSQRVVMGFNTAIKNFKSPAEFQAFLVQLASTPDDFARAQLASSKFGQRVGAVMANMIRPGTESVADMAKVIGTDYTGAVAEAGKVNDSTFGGQALLMLHKFQGTLADMGTNMGDLLIVFALLGPGLTRGLAAALGGLAGIIIPRIVAGFAGAPAIGTAAGAATGGAFGAAVGPALLAGLALALAYYADDIQKWLGTNYDPGKNLPMDQWSWPFGPKNTPHLDIGPLKDVLGGDSTFTQGGKDAGKAASDGLRYGLVAGVPAVQTASVALGKAATAGILDALADTKAERFAAAYAAGIGFPQAVADGIKAARAKPLDAFNALIEMLKHPLSKTAEFARLAGELTSKELAAGLTSIDPEIRAKANAVKQDILARMAEMKPDAGIIGKGTTQALANGLKSSNPDVRANAEMLKAIVEAALKDTQIGAGAAGNDAGRAYATALLARIAEAMKGVTRYGLIPPAQQTPAVNFGGGQAAGGPVRAGVLYRVNESRTEFFRPDVSGTVLPLAPTASLAAGSTRNQNFYIDHVTVADVQDETSLIARLRFMALAQGA